MEEKIHPIDRITSWLTKYKVWFETLLCIILSFAGVFVSYKVYQIEDNRYTKEQIADEPYIVINSNYIRIENNLVNQFSIFNTGGTIRDIFIYVIPFVKIAKNDETYQELNPLQGEQTQLDIYLIDANLYFSGKSHQLGSFKEPFFKSSRISRLLYQYELKNDDSIKMDIFYYVAMSYVDEMNNKIEKDIYLTSYGSIIPETYVDYSVPFSITNFADIDPSVSEEEFINQLYQQFDTLKVKL